MKRALAALMIAALLGAGDPVAAPHRRRRRRHHDAVTDAGARHTHRHRRVARAAHARERAHAHVARRSPSSGATSVLLNLTTVGADQLGYVSAWPCGSSQPDTSIVNFEPGRAVPNMVVLAYTSAGVCFVVLVAGAPRRRSHRGHRQRRRRRHRPAAAGRHPRHHPARREHRTAGRRSPAHRACPARSPAPSRTSRSSNRPPTGTRSSSRAASTTNASTVNFRRGEFVAHLTISALSSGSLCVVTSVATDVIVDSFGYVATGSVKPLAPARLLDTRTGLGGTTGRIASGATARLQVTGSRQRARRAPSARPSTSWRSRAAATASSRSGRATPTTRSPPR